MESLLYGSRKPVMMETMAPTSKVFKNNLDQFFKFNLSAPPRLYFTNVHIKKPFPDRHISKISTAYYIQDEKQRSDAHEVAGFRHMGDHIWAIGRTFGLWNRTKLCTASRRL